MANSKLKLPSVDAARLHAQFKKLVDSSSKGLDTFLSGTILSVIGFAIGFLILLFDYFQFNDLERDFTNTSQFKLFFLAVTAQTVFWAIACGSMWEALSSLTKHIKNHKIEILIWCFLFTVLIYASKYFAVSCSYNLRNHELKMTLLNIIGGIVAILAGLGSTLVNIGLRNILTTNIQDKDFKGDEKVQGILIEYLRLRANLLHFLSLLGVMLGLVTLAQSAKRNAILISSLSECPPGSLLPADFSPDKVLVYGLYYTLMLVLIFFPTFSILITTGRKLRDDILPIPSPHSNEWDSWCAKREKLEQILALSLPESLRAIIAIAAPIIGSLISIFR